MERKSKKEIKNDYTQLDEILGTGEPITEFADEIEREIFPVPLMHFSEFMSSLGIINSEALWTNFLSEETTEAVMQVLKMSFRKSDEKEILKIVNAKNYPLIIKRIMSLNGIEIDKGNSAESDDKKKE